jgi:hypothetical protein
MGTNLDTKYITVTFGLWQTLDTCPTSLQLVVSSWLLVSFYQSVTNESVLVKNRPLVYNRKNLYTVSIVQ